MDKHDVLQKLHTAKRDHLAWVGRAELLTDGVPIEKEHIPVLHTDCKFGRWYFDEGQALADFPEFHKIDEAHRALHQAYAGVFKIITEEENASGFSKLLGFAKRKKEKNAPLIKQRMNELEQASRTVVRHLDELESKIKQMSDEQVKKLFE